MVGDFDEAFFGSGAIAGLPAVVAERMAAGAGEPEAAAAWAHRSPGRTRCCASG